ncbi:MAG: glycosyltransferase family 2 protein [Polyangiaceae bacterium]|jgi:glycosyltransferase involved in cell wall biosynthesis
MLGGATVVVIVPAFNEEERVARVVATMPPEVDEILVVDDASRDATAKRAEESGDPRVTVLTHGTNRGVGAAIATGYREALARGGGARDAFVVMAGDGQMDPRDLPALTSPVTRGEADYVKGNRFSHDDANVMPPARRLGGVLFSALTSVAIGQPIHDSQCGYTALARAACARLDLDDLWPRYGYPNDLLGQLAVRHMRIREVTVRPVYAGEKSGLRVWHLGRIAQLVGRAWLRRTIG